MNEENNMLNILKYYLGTGLRVTFTLPGENIEGTLFQLGESWLKGKTTCLIIEQDKDNFRQIHLVKSAIGLKIHLRPLADLIPELAEWWNNKFDETGDAADHYLRDVIKYNPTYLPYHIAEKIFELHGDLFGLLDQGLAVKEE